MSVIYGGRGDREDKEVFSVYASGMCEIGLIQERLVKFDPSFWLWVKRWFGVTFEQDLESLVK